MIVKYKRLYPVGPYLNEEIGFEIELDTPDPIKEVEYLKNLCDEAHKKLNPHLYVDGQSLMPLNESHPSMQPKESRIDILIKEIQECSQISELNQYGREVGLVVYEKEANENAASRAAYDLKMMELTKK